MSEALLRGLGADRLEVSGTVRLLEGRATRFGTRGPYSLAFDGTGRFVLRFEGALPETSAFDGRRGWATDWTGVPRPLELLDLEATQLEVAMMSGLWLAPGGPFAASEAKGGGGAGRLALVHRTGRLRAELRLAPATSLPLALVCPLVTGGEEWRFGDYRELEGLRVPARTTMDSGSPAPRAYLLEAAGVMDGVAFARALRRPRAPRADVRFASGRSPDLRIARGRSGHVFARARLGGLGPLWFLLDTGGGGSTLLDRRLARRLDTETVGTTSVGGLFGTVRSPLLRGPALRVGPLTLARPFLVPLDVSFLRPLAGFPVAGVLGWDLFSRCVSELDLSRDRVRLHDPARYALPRGRRWHRLLVHLRHPVVPARWEGRRGLFRVDLGAAGGPFGNLTLHSPTVARERLLDGRESREGQVSGLPVRFGRIASFALAGRRFAKVGSAFATEPRGAFADPYTDGNIGANVLRFFRLILDLGHARAAWIKA